MSSRVRLRLREIALGLDEEETLLASRAAEAAGAAVTDLADLTVVREGLDARHKPRLLRVFTVEFCLPRTPQLAAALASNRRLEEVAETPLPPLVRIRNQQRVLVVGMGPAGLFAARRLAAAGLPRDPGRAGPAGGTAGQGRARLLATGMPR